MSTFGGRYVLVDNVAVDNIYESIYRFLLLRRENEKREFWKRNGPLIEERMDSEEGNNLCM